MPHHVQINPENKVNLVLVDVFGKLLILLAFSSIDIRLWNKWDEDYIVSIFNFVNKFLTLNGVVLLYHFDDPFMLKEIQSYLENYNV
jgi:hypothetical protein